MGGKRRSEAEILAELKEQTARLEAKAARRIKIDTDPFAAACDKALKAIDKVLELADKTAWPKVVSRCQLAITELELVLEPEADDAAGGDSNA